MAKRKRLSEIGKQATIKVRKQDTPESYCYGEKNLCNEVDFVASSLNRTGHYLRSNDLKLGQECEVFTNAVIRVDTSKQLISSSTNSDYNQSDIRTNIKTCTNDRLQNGGVQNNRAYVRDDSGYRSDEFSDTSSDTDVCSTGEELVFEQEKVPEVSASVKTIKQELVIQSDCVNNDVDNDESDEIFTSECVDIISEKVPKSVDKRWARNSLESGVGKYLYKNGRLKRSHSLPEVFRREKYINPDHKETIYIKHDREDSDIGDEFGAELWTYNTRQEDGTIYKQHFFVNVKLDGPAAKMKIKSYDEIVLLNDSFVPNLVHSDVIKLFKEVKVDGKTRFKLILRRLLCREGRDKTWEWLDTSAILAPDSVRDKDKYPEVKKEKSKLVRSNTIVTETVNSYKTEKQQHYLDVKDNSIVADVMTGTSADKSKRIRKTLYLDILPGIPPKVSRKVTLCCEINSKYIAIGHENQTKLDETPMYFDIDEKGNDISFKNNGRYLACNNHNLKIEPSNCEYMFTEIRFKHDGIGFDEVDNRMSGDTSSCRYRPESTRRRVVSITCCSENGKYDTRNNNITLKRSQESMELDTETPGLCARKRSLTLTTSQNGSERRCNTGAEPLKTPTTPLKNLNL